VEITEDDEKVCMTMHPCGSGQMLCQKGAYEPPINLSMIEKPHAMTWGKTDFPIYCTSMPVREILSIEQLGYPTNVTFHEGKNFAKEPCTVCIYKKVEDTPEEIYTRVGKTKSDELK
jgi:hypothetical protein